MRGWWVLWLCVCASFFSVRVKGEPNLEEMIPEGDEEGDETGYEPSSDGSEVGEEFTENEDVYEEPKITILQMQGLHGKMDTNGDGKISLPEVMEFSQATRRTMAERDAIGVLEDMDSDKDGKVSRSEFFGSQFATPPTHEGLSEEKSAEEKVAAAGADETGKMQQDMEMQKFQIGDKNGDGFLDLQELPTVLFPELHDGVLALTATFTVKLRDKDADGELSQDELWEVDKSEDAAAQEESQREQDGIFKKLDKDKSGKLNVEEVKAWESGAFHTSYSMKQLFDAADKDKDQHITLEEFKNSHPTVSSNLEVNSHLTELADHNEL